MIYLISSLLFFAYHKLRAKRKNEVFYAPWYTAQLGTFKSLRILLNGTQAQNEIFVFNTKIFMCMLLGGICEFLGSILVLYSYRSALTANINQGICSAFLSSQCITVTFASYYLYKERVYCIQLVGILLIVISLFLIVLNQPEELPIQFTHIGSFEKKEEEESLL